MTDFAATRRAAGPRKACLRGLWLTFLGPFGLEVAATGGAEWIGLDLQHGGLSQAEVMPLLRVSRVPVLARLASHDPADLARVLDTGVDGVIIPAVESAGQAEALVAAAYPPPRGGRSAGLSRSSVLAKEGQPLLLAMVETRAGLEAVDEIVGTDGVDGVFVGPYDLSLSLEQPSVLAPSVVTAIEHIVSSAHARGRLAGVFAGNPDLAKSLPDVDLLGVDTDAAALRAGLQVLFGDGQPTTPRRTS